MFKMNPVTPLPEFKTTSKDVALQITAQRNVLYRERPGVFRLNALQLQGSVYVVDSIGNLKQGGSLIV
jgi:hypothetical protein